MIPIFSTTLQTEVLLHRQLQLVGVGRLGGDESLHVFVVPHCNDWYIIYDDDDDDGDDDDDNNDINDNLILEQQV